MGNERGFSPERETARAVLTALNIFSLPNIKVYSLLEMKKEQITIQVALSLLRVLLNGLSIIYKELKDAKKDL